MLHTRTAPVLCAVASTNEEYAVAELCRFQWPRGLRRGSAAARLLGLWVRIPPRAWMNVSCECCMLSGRGLCVGLITRPEESYRVWWVWVWSRILDNEEACAKESCCTWVKKNHCSVRNARRRQKHRNRATKSGRARSAPVGMIRYTVMWTKRIACSACGNRQALKDSNQTSNNTFSSEVWNHKTYMIFAVVPAVNILKDGSSTLLRNTRPHPQNFQMRIPYVKILYKGWIKSSGNSSIVLKWLYYLR
jgi:hypothetical protein